MATIQVPTQSRVAANSRRVKPSNPIRAHIQGTLRVRLIDPTDNFRFVRLFCLHLT